MEYLVFETFLAYSHDDNYFFFEHSKQSKQWVQNPDFLIYKCAMAFFVPKDSGG